MKSHSFFFGLLLCFALLTAVIGCTSTDGVVGPKNDAASELESATLHKVSPQAIWADCELFGTVGTPAHFKPGRGNFDELYNVGAVGGAFKDGAGAISESKPGDQDFNGGRWHVNVLRAGIDPYKYQNACSVEELDLNDFVGTDTYFECPLIPSRGRN